MKTFVQEVKRIANSLHCDGRSLRPPRLGPDPRAVLQKLIDALIVIPEFNVEVARGQAILEQAQVTLSELNRGSSSSSSTLQDSSSQMLTTLLRHSSHLYAPTVVVLAMISTTALPLMVDPSLRTMAHHVLRPRTGTYDHTCRRYYLGLQQGALECELSGQAA
jgi:hypothetical protein